MRRCLIGEKCRQFWTAPSFHFTTIIFQLTTKSFSTTSQTELENRLHALTESLIHKQTMLEALSTEKNSLGLQLERLEVSHIKLLCYANQQTSDFEESDWSFPRHDFQDPTKYLWSQGWPSSLPFPGKWDRCLMEPRNSCRGGGGPVKFYKVRGLQFILVSSLHVQMLLDDSGREF